MKGKDSCIQGWKKKVESTCEPGVVSARKIGAGQVL